MTRYNNTVYLHVLLENNHKYIKDFDAMRENVQDAIQRHDMEGVVRIFLDRVMRKEGFFYQLSSHARAVLMDNAKSLGGELASVTQRLTLEGHHAHITGKGRTKSKVSASNSRHTC